MTTIDLVFLCLICFGVARGLFKGFISEIASLASIFIGGYGAIYFSNHTAAILRTSLNWSTNTITVFSFVFTFIGIFIATLAVGKLTTKLFNLVSLGLINRFLGGVFGGLKISLILSVLLFFLNQFKIDKAINLDYKPDKSIFYPWVESLAPKILPEFSNLEGPKQFLFTN